MLMNTKHLLLIFVCLTAGVLSSVACIQGTWITKPKDSLPADVFKLHVHIASEPLQLEVRLLDGTVKKMTGGKSASDPQGDFRSMIIDYEANPSLHVSYAERIDYSAALLFARRYNDAVTILIQLEKDFPEKYATASNLGTAYELTGDIDKALEWIKTGMARNADSHEGTEWLHVAILETKLKLKADPAWLAKNSVLDGSKSLPREVKERALEYQLNERLYFIHENDLIMCDLMYQAALITTDSAKKAYFIRQVPRFGNIRDYAVSKLSRS